MTATDALWAIMDALHGGAEDDPHPERSITVQDYADRYGVSYSSATGQLRRLVAAGKLRDGWKRTTNGRRQLVRCYWVP